MLKAHKPEHAVMASQLHKSQEIPLSSCILLNIDF